MPYKAKYKERKGKPVPKQKVTRCKWWDSGWCYKPDSEYQCGCVGYRLCRYMRGEQ